MASLNIENETRLSDGGVRIQRMVFTGLTMEEVVQGWRLAGTPGINGTQVTVDYVAPDVSEFYDKDKITIVRPNKN